MQQPYCSRGDAALQQLRRKDAPVPYWLMCSGWVLLSLSMASMMCFMPPGFLMDSVEKLVWAPVPAEE